MLARTLLAVSLAAAIASSAFAAGDALTCIPDSLDSVVGASPRVAAPDAPFTRAEASVPANKRTTRGLYLTAQDAFDMVNENPAAVLFVDVRTRGELQFIGMPTLVDAHVPFLVETNPPVWDTAASSFKLAPNPDFLATVDKRRAEKGLTRDATVIVICQGGTRAGRAVNALTEAGYAKVYTVVDGFEGDPVAEGPHKGERLVNGWRNAGLPWTTRLDRGKMYGLD